MNKYLIPVMVFIFCVQPAFAATYGGEDPVNKQVEAQMPKDWQTCNENNNCVLIQFGCSSITSVNKNHVSEATKLAYQIGHDPAAIKCASKKQLPYIPSCTNNQCNAAHSEE